MPTPPGPPPLTAPRARLRDRLRALNVAVLACSIAAIIGGAVLAVVIIRQANGRAEIRRLEHRTPTTVVGPAGPAGPPGASGPPGSSSTPASTPRSTATTIAGRSSSPTSTTTTRPSSPPSSSPPPPTTTTTRPGPTLPTLPPITLPRR